MILACSVAIWALLSFPREPAAAHARLRRPDRAGEQRRGPAGAGAGAARASASSRAMPGGMGHAIEPALAPMGFDWKIGVGLIGAFAAREVFISTMGIIYGMGEGADEDEPGPARADAGGAPPGRVAGLHAAGGADADDLLLALLPVHEHAGRGAAGDRVLALADLPVQLHDGAGLAGGDGGLPDRAARSASAEGASRLDRAPVRVPVWRARLSSSLTDPTSSRFRRRASDAGDGGSAHRWLAFC